jgi:hypothetical protein
MSKMSLLLLMWHTCVHRGKGKWGGVGWGGAGGGVHPLVVSNMM